MERRASGVRVTGEQPVEFGVLMEVQPGDVLHPSPTGRFGIEIGMEGAEVGGHAPGMPPDRSRAWSFSQAPDDTEREASGCRYVRRIVRACAQTASRNPHAGPLPAGARNLGGSPSLSAAPPVITQAPRFP
jgi:hypothetical protein